MIFFCELFKTLDNIFETHMVFGKISVVLEYLVEKRQQASNAYDEVVDWKKHTKYKPDNVTLLTNLQLKMIKTILRAWEDLDETVDEAIKKAQAICSKRWYEVDNIIDELSFPTMVLIEKAYPLGLMIEQVEQRHDEGEEKINKLEHVSIHNVDQLIRHPFVVERKIHIFI